MSTAAAVALPPPADDPAAAAADAGLRYVTDEKPGITRRRHGKGFSYRDPDGKPLRDAETLQRIRSLAIPPAWTDVWICPNPRGHIQATGRDARGRKQYRYHPHWREVRDATKFERMAEFGEALPALRRRIRRDLARPGMPREKVLATVVRLLETTCIRVGNDEYLKSNGTFGLTTLRNHHVAVRGDRLFFRLRAKGGKRQEAKLSDRSVAKVIRECQEIPGYELFQYRDDEGAPQPIDSADVNDYLRAVTGRQFTAKDFRTWMGSVHALAKLREVCAGEIKATKARLLEVLDYVAAQLGNTRAVTRKFYVHPGLQREYLEGRLIARLARLEEPRPVSGLRADETVLLALLRTL
ncbi:MAG TPA: DNA topoisomerase IB [Thermoanaerobaculia bacterium]|nr:DNA topoisomerase IB [Thermoanaerobaculia bacterium]